jgi:hypothetical protein
MKNAVSGADTAEKKLALALTLSHEGRRDGVVDENNQAETRTAVWAHTEMAVRMLKDNATSSVMKAAINGSENLQNDLGAYMTAKMKGDDTIFDKYVDGTYDSSADYWKLIKNEKGEYGFKWDGHLNIYNEGGNNINPGDGLELRYDEIQDLLNANKGKEKITLKGGIEISADKLKEIQRYNITMWLSDSDHPSSAGRALFDDGFMSYTEALGISDSIKTRFLPSVNMIEHYSARYVVNSNEWFMDKITQDEIRNWTGNNDRARAESGDESYWKKLTYTVSLGGSETREVTLNARLLKQADSVFHGEGAFKWVFEDGNEIVIDSTGKFETREEYLGTYNFGGPTGVKHAAFDVAPYIFWGNSPDDKTNILSRANTGWPQFVGQIGEDISKAYKHHNSIDFMIDIMGLRYIDIF